MSATVKFSLCHTTLRLPDGWRKACQVWFDLADDPEACEYILCTEEPFAIDRSTVPWPHFKQIDNACRKTAVSGWNTAGAASTGEFLITVADDFFPCAHWDSEIRSLVPNMNEARVVAPRLGEPGDSLLYFSLLTRAAYERYGGWFFYPEYWGMYADDDFTEWARREDIVIDTPLDFIHLHPVFGTGEWDETYLWQHDPGAFARGKEILAWRRASGFQTRPEEVERCLVDPGRVKHAETAPARKPSIAICLPGESFSSAWVSNWTNVFTWLLFKGYDPAPLFTHTRSVFVTRASLVYEFRHSKTPFDLMLWIDDDNIVLPEHLDSLLRDLAEHPEADVVAGWCWIEPPRGEKAVTPSCGRLRPGYLIDPFKPEEIRAAGLRNELLPAGYSGFPVVLMRYAVFGKLGEHPFMPFTSPSMRWGTTGEDVAFCARLAEAGCRLFIDPNVKVPHLKLMEIPDPPDFADGSAERAESGDDRRRRSLEVAMAAHAESGDGGPHVLERIRQVFQPGHRANLPKEGVPV